MGYRDVFAAGLAIALWASPALAQLGLQGAPEMMQLPAGAAQVQQPIYPTTMVPPLMPADASMRPIATAATMSYAGYQGQPAGAPPTPAPPLGRPPVVPGMPGPAPGLTSAPALTPVPVPGPQMAPPGPVPGGPYPPQAPSVVNQMIDPAYGYGAPNGSCNGCANGAVPNGYGPGYYGNGYASGNGYAVGNAYGVGNGCANGACGVGPVGARGWGVGEGPFGSAWSASNFECFPPFAPHPCWYGSAAGLVMSRNKSNRLWTTYETNVNYNQIPLDAEVGWQGGFEIKIGRVFGGCAPACPPAYGPCGYGGDWAGYGGQNGYGSACGPAGCDPGCGPTCAPVCDTGLWALEATYWWLNQLDGYSAIDPDSLSTTLNFTDLIYPDPAAAARDPARPLPLNLFNNAFEHRVVRINEVQNLELNLIRLQMMSGGYRNLNIDWMVGVRWFQFREQYTFSSRVGPNWDNPMLVGVLDERITNDLVGAQFGFNASYAFAPRWRFTLTPKFGIYNNHIESRFDGYRANGDHFGPDPNAPGGLSGVFPETGSTNALSFLTQVDLGLEWQFHPQWTLFGGYRVLWATGMGLAENQFPQYICDLPEYRSPKYNGELVLHGAFAGLKFCF